MRCPQCTERNSVAARDCKFCGEKLKKSAKPIPQSLKFAAAGAVVLVAGTLFLSAMLPQLVDVEAKVGRVAKRVATGPRSTEDANAMRKDLDDVVKDFLTQNGDIKDSAVLRDRLMKALSRSTFEVHVVDLPRGMRVVEVDTLLQATPYLVMKGQSGTKVFKLNGLEVFDDARIINDTAGPVLVVLGHTGGQLPHRPQIRAYALLPDFIQEESDKVVPPLLAEGHAKFVAANSHDINVEVSLPSTLQQMGFFAVSPIKEYVPLRQNFIWKDAHYVAKNEAPEGSTSLLWNIAQVIRRPEDADSTKSALGDAGVRFAKTVAGKAQYAFSKASEGRNTKYTLVGDGKKIEFNFRRSSSGTRFVSGNTTQIEPAIASAQLQKAIIANKVPHADSTPPAMAARPAAAAPVVTAAPVPETVQQAAVVEVRPTVQATTVQSPPAKLAEHGAAEIRVATSAFGRTAAPEAASTKTTGAVIHPVHKPRPELAPLPTTNNRTVVHDSSAVMAATLPTPVTRPIPEAVVVRTPPKPASTGGGKTARATMNRNIRNNPTSRSHSIGTMTIGSNVQVLGKTDGWYKVRVNGTEGYVYGGVATSDVPSIQAETRPSFERTSRRASKRDDNNNTASVAAESKPDASSTRTARSKSKKSRQVAADPAADTGPVVINLDAPRNKVKLAQKKSKEAAGPPDFVP